MHSAVLQNKKYIEFAKQNTVEVLTLGRLDEGVQRMDKRAVAYRAKDASGQETLLMLHWPNLSYAEILALDRSPAARYNKTGKIPYTSIVNPHTLEEMKGMVGGQSAKGVQEAAEEARKQLQKEHGKGLSRKELARVDDAAAAARGLLAAKDYAKALEALAKAGDGSAHEVLAAKIQAVRAEIRDAAKSELAALREQAEQDRTAARKALGSLIGRLRGTGLEAEAAELLKSLQAG
jgi:hypothetical protein